MIIAHHQVEDPSSSTFSDLVSQCRETFLRKVLKVLTDVEKSFHRDGIVTLPNFLTEDAVSAVVRTLQ